jgi:hypothetical protein
LDELCHLTVVPARTQTSAFPLALGIFGVVEAELPPLRFTSITHGADSDPQVLLAVHIDSGFGSEQRCLWPPSSFSLAVRKATAGINARQKRRKPKLRGKFI